MNRAQTMPTDRFLATLMIVAQEAQHLAYSQSRVFGENINAEWVRSLENQPELAERLEAFVSRFGRMQDTIGGKLFPRWLAAQAEEPGTHIEVLNRAERLGVLEDVERWLEARALRNRLVHEYMENPEEFAADLILAGEYCDMLFDTYTRLRDFAAERMGIENERLPGLRTPHL
ncbi:hypothetical protein ACNSTU_15790 [Aquisalimonas sp. APHAB1-3]|uniref:hypothetical protein n=1 Tax=Aquisalimonas sp. APHAB1-3 TaxID=3402080 RepID=UPI003AB070B6